MCKDCGNPNHTSDSQSNLYQFPTLRNERGLVNITSQRNVRAVIPAVAPGLYTSIITLAQGEVIGVGRFPSSAINAFLVLSNVQIAANIPVGGDAVFIAFVEYIGLDGRIHELGAISAWNSTIDTLANVTITQQSVPLIIETPITTDSPPNLGTFMVDVLVGGATNIYVRGNLSIMYAGG